MSTLVESSADQVVSYRVPYWQTFPLPILAGRLSGSRWLPASGGKIVRLICGTYEKAQTELFHQHVTADSTVFDLGANVGYYTLLASKLARQGQVIAFEPEPRNAAFLRSNIAANSCRNVVIHELAVSAETGISYFKMGRGTGTGALANEGTLQVKTVKLDEFVASSGLQPTHLKIDVEGAEIDVFHGGMETLKACRPTIFLSTHGPAVHAACCEVLQDLKYDLQAIEGDNVETATELLCIG
jgi:FkbM family methyltransferase